MQLPFHEQQFAQERGRREVAEREYARLRAQLGPPGLVVNEGAAPAAYPARRAPYDPTPKAKPIPPRPRHRPNAAVQAQWVRTKLQHLPYEPPVEHYRQCTNNVLKGMCRVRGLPVSGLKQNLVERLNEIDNRVCTAEIR